MSTLHRAGGFVLLAGLLWGCPSGEEAPKDKPKPATETAGAGAQAASQPSAKGPASASSRPANHPETSSVAANLKAMFAMPTLDGDAVAKVAGRPVDKARLENELRQMQIQLSATGLPDGMTRDKILNGAVERLVEREMMAVLAAELGAKPDPAYAKAWLDNLEKRMEAQPTFKAFLLRAGKDAEQRKRDAEQAALRQAVMDKVKAQVKAETEAEAKKYYDSHAADYTERGGREVWRIFVKAPRGMIQRDRDIARGRAEGLLEKAKKDPKNFVNLAKSHSEGGKGAGGGFIGWVAEGTLAPELDKQVSAAKTNSILPLWEDASGFFVYKVGKTRKTRVKPFDEVADEILGKVYRRAIKRKIADEISRLRKATSVEILIPELEPKKN